MPIENPPRITVRLHTVFAAVLLAMLLLPLTGMYFFRIYENELVRQTESELIAEGVFISTYYKDAFLHAKVKDPANYGRPVIVPQPVLDEKYKVYPVSLDLRTAAILPPRPDTMPAPKPADAVAVSIGKKLTPILQDAKLSTLSGMRVLDYQGVIVAGTGETGKSLAHVEEVAAGLQGIYTSRLRKRLSDEERPALASISRGTDTRVFIAMPIIENDRVIALAYLSRSPRNVLKSLYEERESVFEAAILMLLVTAGVAAMLGYTIAKPLGALTRHAQQLTAGTRAKDKLSSPPISELVSLTQSFEQMSLTIEERSEYIRSFAMHVAHEFKTPLTAIQGAVELLHDHTHDMTPDRRKRFMENIMQDTDRLKTLVSRLLDLARADVMQPGKEVTDTAAIFTTLQKRYAGRLAMTVPETGYMAGIAPDIFETVFVNLAENSLQHGAKSLVITAVQDGKQLQIDVGDDGHGVSEGNAGRLFTPFFTTRRENGGTGLGLTITRSLLRAHGGNIAFVPGKAGANFRISLNLVAA